LIYGADEMIFPPVVPVVCRILDFQRILCLDHVEGDGRSLFEQIVKMDLEGIVCKRKDSPYKVTEKPSRYWIKVKNSRYSQSEGRLIRAANSDFSDLIFMRCGRFVAQVNQLSQE